MAETAGPVLLALKRPLNSLQRAVVLVAAALIAGRLFFPSQQITSATSPPDPSFVGVTRDSAAFIAWTETTSGSLTGQFQIASVTSAGQGRLRIDSHNLSFTGARNGQSISLTLSEFFFTKTLTGTLKGNTLILTVPSSNGLLSTVEMREGTAEDYNRAVLALQQRVAQTNVAVEQREAAARARAAQREAVLRAASTLQDLHSRLANDLARLQRNADFADVLDGYRQTWAEMQEDDAALRADAAKVPFKCGDLDHVRYTDLARLEYSDMAAIQYRHNVAFGNTRDRFLEAVDAVRNDMVVMNATFVELQGAVKADTTKTLSQANVDQLAERTRLGETAADEQVRRATASLQQAETEVRTYNEKSTALLNAAKQFVNSLTCTGY